MSQDVCTQETVEYVSELEDDYTDLWANTEQLLDKHLLSYLIVTNRYPGNYATGDCIFDESSYSKTWYDENPTYETPCANLDEEEIFPSLELSPTPDVSLSSEPSENSSQYQEMQQEASLGPVAVNFRKDSSNFLQLFIFSGDRKETVPLELEEYVRKNYKVFVFHVD